MKRIIALLLGLVAVLALLIGVLLAKMTHKPDVQEVIVTRIDTVIVRQPQPVEEISLGQRTYDLPKYVIVERDAPHEHETAELLDTMTLCVDDSVSVSLPMVQRHYADSTYEAWVSGPLDPRLDSLRVYNKETIVTRIEGTPKRWHIGVTAGYGYTAKGFHPYIGIGITYSFVSF